MKCRNDCPNEQYLKGFCLGCWSKIPPHMRNLSPFRLKNFFKLRFCSYKVAKRMP